LSHQIAKSSSAVGVKRWSLYPNSRLYHTWREKEQLVLMWALVSGSWQQSMHCTGCSSPLLSSLSAVHKRSCSANRTWSLWARGTTGMGEEADGWALRRRPNVVAVGVGRLWDSPRRSPSA
jgi:hypothetical protein